MTQRRKPPSGVIWSLDDGKVVVDVEPQKRRPFGRPEHVTDVSRSGDEVSGPHNRPVLEVDTAEGDVVNDIPTEDDGAPTA